MIHLPECWQPKAGETEEHRLSLQPSKNGEYYYEWRQAISNVDHHHLQDATSPNSCHAGRLLQNEMNCH